MEYKSSSSPSKNSYARKSTFRSNVVATAKISIVVFMSFCLSCVTGKIQNKKGYLNILEQYFKNQHYGKGENGRAFREAEQKIVNKMEWEFDSAKSMIIIKELCRPYELSGYVYSDEVKKGNFFYQANQLAELKFYDPHSFVEPVLYNRIMDLLKKDSLDYYKKVNDADLPADDEFCWLVVTYAVQNKNIYTEKRFVFNNPLALRSKIIPF